VDKLTVYIEGTGQVTVSEQPCADGNHTVDDSDGFHVYNYTDCAGSEKDVTLTVDT